MAYIKDCCLKPARWYCDCPSTPQPVEIESDVVSMATVPCTYLGDMLSNISQRVGSAVSYHNGKMYILSIQQNTISGANGWITIYDVNTNARLVDKQIPYIAHGNGMCWDDKRKQFIIAPVFQTALSSSGRNYTLITADEDFNIIGQFPITDTSGAQINAMSVSYDYVTERTYVYAYNGHTVYEYTGKPQLTEVCHIAYDSHGFDMNQGFAVYDDTFYLSSPKSNFIIGSVTTGQIYGEKYVSNIDDMGRRWLGELEDWEFGPDGVLYGLRLSKFQTTNVSRNTVGWCSNIVCAISVKEYKLPNWFSTSSGWERITEEYTLGHYSFTWDVSNNFWISISAIRRPEQLDMYVLDSSYQTSIEINSIDFNNINFGTIVITKPQFWHITKPGAKVTCDKIYVYQPLTIYGASGNTDYTSGIHFTGNDTFHFSLDRLGSLCLCGSSERLGFTIDSGDTLIIAVGYTMPITKIYKNPRVNGIAGQAGTVRIGSSEPEDTRGMYMGSKKIAEL